MKITQLQTMRVYHLSWAMQYDWIEGRFRSCDWLALRGYR